MNTFALAMRERTWFGKLRSTWLYLYVCIRKYVFNNNNQIREAVNLRSNKEVLKE